MIVHFNGIAAKHPIIQININCLDIGKLVRGKNDKHFRIELELIILHSTNLIMFEAIQWNHLDICLIQSIFKLLRKHSSIILHPFTNRVEAFE